MKANDKVLIKKLSELSFMSGNKLFELINDELKDYSYEIKLDFSGNITINKTGTGKSINALFEISPIGVAQINPFDNKGEFDTIGKYEKSDFVNDIIYKDDVAIGIIREKKTDAKDEKKFYIEYIDKKEREIPEIYNFKQELICKDDSLYGLNLSSIISCYIMICLLKELSTCDKHITFTIWNSTICNSLKNSCAENNNLGLFVSSVLAQDGCDIEKGPSICVKDGCYVINSATKNKLNVILDDNFENQCFAGKAIPALEEYSLSNFIDMVGVYYPTKQKNTKIEQIYLKDVEKTLNLLLKIIVNM